MAKQDWVWMPHAAHLIISKWCRFHLSTYVNGYIVSTVGEYFPDREIIKILKGFDSELMSLKVDSFDHYYLKKYGYEEIGPNRKYETMVFNARKMSCEDKNALCCPYIMDNPDNLDFMSYNNSLDAYEGHLSICNKWDKLPSLDSLMKGELYKKHICNASSLKESQLIEDYEFENIKINIIKNLLNKYERTINTRQ